MDSNFLKALRARAADIFGLCFPGFVILELCFGRGYFHRIPADWLEFLLFVLYGFALSSPIYVATSVILWEVDRWKTENPKAVPERPIPEKGDAKKTDAQNAAQKQCGEDQDDDKVETGSAEFLLPIQIACAVAVTASYHLIARAIAPGLRLGVPHQVYWLGAAYLMAVLPTMIFLWVLLSFGSGRFLRRA